MKSLTQYFVDAYHELTKVTWMTQKQLWSHTGIVLTVTLLFALYMTVFDSLFQLGFQYLLDNFT